MKNNTKKFLSFILTFAMVLTIIPAFSVNAFATTVYNYTICLKDGKAYQDSSSGADITSAVSAMGLTYNSEASTWNMNNFNFQTSKYMALKIYNAITINVTGTNSITAGSDSDNASRGLLAWSKVTFTGNGILYIAAPSSNMGSFAIDSSSYDITFSGPTVNATAANGESGSYGQSYGINTTKISVTGGTVNAACGSAYAYAAVYSVQTPSATAKITGSETILTYDAGSHKYKDGGTIATSVTLTPAKSISVGTQTGTLTYGTEGSATFNVTKTPTEPEFTNGKIFWKNAGGDFTETAPAGISASLGAFSGGAATLTVTASAAVSAGAYTFEIAGTNGADNLTSSAVTLTIDPKDISGCTATDLSAQTYTYNGTQIKPDISITNGSVALVKDTDYELTYGTNKNAGTDAGLITVAGIGNYTGTKVIKFNINKVEITLESASDSKAYDGTPLTNGAVIVSKGAFAGDEGATYNATGTIRKAGSVENVFTYTLKSNTNADNYSITTSNGILTVTKAETPIVITAASASKQYDGKALTANSYTSSGSLADGDSLTTVVIEGIITDAGVAANIVTSVAITNGEEDVTGCYEIITVSGILTVNPIPVYDDPTYNVPVSGEKGSINASATVSGNNASLSNITEKQLEKAGTEGNVVVDLTTLSKSVTGVTIPKTTFENVSESESEGLEIRMPNGTVAVFDKEALSAVAQQAKGRNIQLVINKDTKAEKTMTKEQKAVIEEMNNPVVLDAYFTSNGSRISDFNGGEAELTAAYPTEFPVRVWYVADDGEKTAVPCTYDGKTAKFTVKHFSHYVIEQLDGSSYKTCAKDDNCMLAKYTDIVKDDWYHDGVHFCAERKYMNGISETEFAPMSSLSRAMIVQILWNMEGNPYADYAMSFTDVEADAWYAEAIRWAQALGIVDGYDDNLFGPNDNVTREQLAKILYSYAAYKKYDVTASEELTEFTDADKTSDWALEALKWAKAAELVSGKGNGILDPAGNATRAEAATMIMNFCEKIAK